MRPVNVSLFVLATCAAFSAAAQAPPGINYQGVARDAEGKPLSSRDISIRISILKDGENGQTEYVETHSARTNSFGLFTLVIGKGEPVVGDFRFISWAVGTKWMKVDMDPDGGNNFKPMGAQSFMSVPYAFYSQYSGNGLTAGQGISINNSVISNTGDGDNNSLNETNTAVTLGADRRLRITDAAGTKEVDLSPLAAQQQLSGVLALGNDAGNQKITNLGTPTEPADAATKAYVDAQSGNQTLQLSSSGQERTISLTNGGSVTLDVADADDDPGNEIQDLSIVAHQLLLTGDVTSVNLTPYLDNTDSQSLSMGAASGNNRTINIANGTGVTFSVADGDSDATNELQRLGLSFHTLTLTGDPVSIDLAPYLDNTDNQNLSNGPSSGTNRTINIGNGTGVTFSVADNDNDAANELQDLSLSGTTLALTGDGTTVNLAPYLDNTDNQILSSTATGTTRTIGISGGNIVNFSVADDDNSPTNEIQDLTLSGNTLALTNDPTTINLAPYLDNTDAQTLTYTSASKTLAITGGNTVTIPETQSLAQVLAIGADAGAQRITNVATPTAPADAVTKQYVDNINTTLNAAITTTYAFKTNFAYINGSGLAASDVTIPFGAEVFDDFNVVAGSSFTAPQNGVYVFVIDGSLSGLPLPGPQLSFLFLGVKYPVAIGSRYNSTQMFRMNAGQTITLVGDNVLVGGSFTGTFYGYKL